jgi:hypothetical protein
MVRRSMSSGDVDGISQMSQTIGSTTASVQWSNPSGAFYLSQLDKETLGLAGNNGRAGFATLSGAHNRRCEWEDTCHCN